MILNRGDIVTVLFPFSSGTGAKQRPALVVQNDVNNRRMTNVIVAAITTTKHRSGQPTQLLVEFASPVGQQSGLAHDSVVTCENLVTLDKSLRLINSTFAQPTPRLYSSIRPRMAFSISFAAGTTADSSDGLYGVGANAPLTRLIGASRSLNAASAT